VKLINVSRYTAVWFVLLLGFLPGRVAVAMEIITHAEGFRPGSHKLEYRDLGFEHTDLIPADESAITSLVETANGDIYGGTTGRICHLFVFSPLNDKARLLCNRVKHLGKISGHESIHHSLVAAPDGTIYVGTGLNEIQQHPISDPPPGNAGITISLWQDIKARYAEYEGGHLYKYDPAAEKRTWIGPEQQWVAEDLGIPMPNNGIYTMTINNDRQEIYGVTYPDGHFFVYYIKARKFTDLGPIYKKTVYAGPDNRTLRTITRALICDNDGFVYGAADDGVIFKFDPLKLSIEKLPVRIPQIYYSTIETLVKDRRAMIYGGTLEGYLFKFDPEQMKVTNLGKPLAQRRIRGLTIGANGIMYGIAGQRSNHCRLFSYDRADAAFEDLGILKVVREPYYQWTAVQMDSILTGKDGVIYIGEAERRSHLFLYYP